MVNFGIALTAGPKADYLNGWVTDLDFAIPKLAPRFESLWITDHFFWDDRPTHEAWTGMTYLAARFPNMKVGPMVLGQSYRNPALLAKMGATLQILTGGRFIMGIGAGWKEDEYRAYGYDFPRAGIRIDELEDALQIMRRLWSQPGKVTYHGKHYHIKDAYCEPKPDPVPLIVVGGKGDKTMRLAALHADWWNASDTAYDLYAERVAYLRRVCDDVGRDFATIRLTWFGRLTVGRTESEAQARGGKWQKNNSFCGTPTQVVDQLSEFIALGCDYYMLEIQDMGNPDVIGMIVEDVLPKVGK
jgi:alkanesulfonate monooxygenase SsuD/methylene tetrahydromethanopterin reductase-like flavin-dependent oxidoreductase (luciferase family)